MNFITEEIMNKFRIYLYEEEKSDNTISKYMRDIYFLKQWLNGRAVDKLVMLEYKKKLCEAYSPKSVNSIISSLNSLFDFVQWHELKIKTLKIQRNMFSSKEKELTKSEYQKLLSAAKNKKNKRLYYLIQTIGCTGMRISEVKYITCDSIKKGHAIINSKGKIRQVFLPKQLCKMLKIYIKERKICSGPVFITRNGNPPDRSNIWSEMKKLCCLTGIPEEKVFPHNLRHLFARTYYSAQKDIVRLADVLGHSNVNTTRIYTVETGNVHRQHLEKLGLLLC